MVRDLGGCAAREIRRTWSVTGTNVQCQQVITVEDGPAFDGNITWPQNFEGDCIDNIPTVEPIFTGGFCDQIGTSMTDDTFRLVDNVCYKILRTHTVLDWCVYDANNPSAGGIWTRIQEIKIDDQAAPEITACRDTLISLTANDCVQDVALTMSAMDASCGINQDLTWVLEIDIDGDGTVDIIEDEDLEGNDVEYILEDATPGNYKLKWIVRDGCGNVANCLQDVIIRDGKAPTPYCTGLTTVLMQGSGEIAIWAVDLNVGSFDNCTPSSRLSYSFSGTALVDSMTFNCDSLDNGVSQTFAVNLWVWDEAGNRDFCTVDVVIQDNLNICPDQVSGMARISGEVRLEDGYMLYDAEVGIETFLPEYPRYDSVGVDGTFFFADNPIGYAYDVNTTRETAYTQGVSTLDLVLMQRHILAIQALDSPYKLIAADVNDDDRVRGSDVVILRRLILGIDSTAAAPSWRFVDSEADLLPDSPWPLPRTIVPLQSDDTLDLIAIKTGDVNNSVRYDLELVLDGRSITNYPLEVAQRTTEDGSVWVDVMASDFTVLQGLQLSLAGAQDVAPGKLSVKARHWTSHGDDLYLSWSDKAAVNVQEGDILFSVRLATGNDTDPTDLLTEGLHAELYEGSKTIVTRRISLVPVSERDLTDPGMTVYQNEPNPWTAQTTIAADLPYAGPVQLRIFDVDGKLLHNRTVDGIEGRNAWNVKRTDIGAASGVLIYEVEFDDWTVVKRMILVE